MGAPMANPAPLTPKVKRGGPRPNSGPKKGSKFRKTIEREEQKKQELALVERNRPTSLKIMDDMMMAAAGYASRYQPMYGPNGNLISGDEAKFKMWATLAVEWGSRLAPYRHARLKAVLLQTENTPPTAQPLGPQSPGQILDMEKARDPQQAVSTYLRLVAAAVEDE